MTPSNNEKVADLFLNVSQTGSAPDFDSLMAQGIELVLEKPDIYWKNENVKKMFSNEKGEPNKEKFDNYYKDLAKIHNQYAAHELDVRNLEGLALDNPITRMLGMKTIENPTTFNTRTVNVFDQSIGAVGINKESERNKTIQEVMDSQNFYIDSTTGEKVKQGDAISGFNDFMRRSLRGDVLVAAQWDEDGEHLDPVSNRKVKHKKGDFKLDPETLKPYRETLSGRDVTGKDVMTLGNNLTEEGSMLNQIDFMDSDDLEKSLAGTIAKTAVEIGAYFIPYAGQAYAYTQLGKNLMVGGAEIYKSIKDIISNSKNSRNETTTANQIQGLLGAFTTQGVSEKGRENTFGVENLANMATSIVGELFTQTGAATAALKLGALSSPTKIAQQLAKTGTTNRLKGTLDLLGDQKQLQEVLGESYKNFAAIGAVNSYLYNVAHASKEIADIADEAGLDSRDKGLMHGLGIAGLGALYKFSPFDSWFLNYTGIGDDVTNGLRKALRTELGDVSMLKGMSLPEKTKEVTSRLDKVFNAFKDPDFVRTYAGAAVSEAMEENTEVVFAEGLKSIYNVLQDNGMTFTEDKSKRFKDLFGDQFFTELAMSTVAGGAGGMVFKAAQAKQQINPSLTDYIQMGHKKDLINMVNKEHRNGRLGSTKLTTSPLDISDSGITWKAAEKGDYTHNDFAKDLMLKQIEDTSLFLTKEGYTHEGVIAIQNKIKDTIKLSDPDAEDESLDIASKYYGKKIYLDEKLDTAIKDDVNRLTKQLTEYQAKLNSLSESDPTQALEYQKIYAKKQEVKKELDDIFSIVQDNKSDKLDYYTRKSLFSISTNLLEFLPEYKTKNSFFEENRGEEYKNLTEEEKGIKDSQIEQEWVNYLVTQKKGAINEAFNAFEKFEKTKPFSDFKEFIDTAKTTSKIPIDRQISQNLDVERFLKLPNKIGLQEQYEAAVQIKENQKQIQEILKNKKDSNEKEFTEEENQKLLDLQINTFLNKDKVQLNTIFDYLNSEEVQKSENPTFEGFLQLLQTTQLDSVLYERALENQKALNGDVVVNSFINYLESENAYENILKEILGEDYNEAISNEDVKKLIEEGKDTFYKNFEKYKSGKISFRDFFNKMSIVRDSIFETYVDILDALNKTNLNEEGLVTAQKRLEQNLLKLANQDKSDFFNKNDIAFLEIIENTKLLLNKKNEKVTISLPTSKIEYKKDSKVVSLIDELEQKKKINELADADGSKEEDVLKAIDTLKKHKTYTLATFAYNPTVNAFRSSEKAPQAIKDLSEEERFKFIFDSDMSKNKVIASLAAQDIQNKIDTLEELLHDIREANRSNITELLKESAFEIARIIKSLQSVSNDNVKDEFDKLIDSLKSDMEFPNDDTLKKAYSKLKEAQILFSKNFNQDKYDALQDDVDKKGYENQHELFQVNKDEIVMHNPKVRLVYADTFRRITEFDDILKIIKNFAEQNQNYASLTIQDFSIIQVLSYLQNPNQVSVPVEDDSNKIMSNRSIKNGLMLNQSGGFGKSTVLIKNAVEYEQHLHKGSKVLFTSVGKSQIETLEEALKSQPQAQSIPSYEELFKKFGISYSDKVNEKAYSSIEKNKIPAFYPNQNIDELDSLLDDVIDPDPSVTLVVIDEATRVDFQNIYLLDRAVSKINEKRIKNKQVPLKVIYAGDTSQLSATRKINISELDNKDFLLDSSIKTFNIESTPSIDRSFRTSFKYIADVNTAIRKKIVDADDAAQTNKDKIDSFYFDRPNNFIGVSFTKNENTYGDHISKVIQSAKNNKKKITIFNEEGNSATLSRTLSDKLVGLTEGVDYEIVDVKNVQGGEWDYIIVDSASANSDIGNKIFNEARQLYTINTRAKSAIIYSPNIPLLSDFVNQSSKTDDDIPPIVQNLKTHPEKALNTVLLHRDSKIKALEGYDFKSKGTAIKKEELKADPSPKSKSDPKPESEVTSNYLTIPLLNYNYEAIENSGVSKETYEKIQAYFNHLIQLEKSGLNKDGSITEINYFTTNKIRDVKFYIKLVSKDDASLANSLDPTLPKKPISHYSSEIEKEFKSIPVVYAKFTMSGSNIEVPISHAYRLLEKNNSEYRKRLQLEKIYEGTKSEEDKIIEIDFSNSYSIMEFKGKQVKNYDEFEIPGYTKSLPIAIPQDLEIFGKTYKKGREFAIFGLIGTEFQDVNDYKVIERILEIEKNNNQTEREAHLGKYRIIVLDKKPMTNEDLFDDLEKAAANITTSENKLLNANFSKLDDIRKNSFIKLLSAYLALSKYNDYDTKFLLDLNTGTNTSLESIKNKLKTIITKVDESNVENQYSEKAINERYDAIINYLEKLDETSTNLLYKKKFSLYKKLTTLTDNYKTFLPKRIATIESLLKEAEHNKDEKEILKLENELTRKKEALQTIDLKKQGFKNLLGEKNITRIRQSSDPIKGSSTDFMYMNNNNIYELNAPQYKVFLKMKDLESKINSLAAEEQEEIRNEANIKSSQYEELKKKIESSSFPAKIKDEMKKDAKNYVDRGGEFANVYEEGGKYYLINSDETSGEKDIEIKKFDVKTDQKINSRFLTNSNLTGDQPINQNQLNYEKNQKKFTLVGSPATPTKSQEEKVSQIVNDFIENEYNTADKDEKSIILSGFIANDIDNLTEEDLKKLKEAISCQ